MSTRTVGLTNLQLELLKKFSKPVSGEDLLEINKTLAQFFANKATATADKGWDKKGYTKKDAEKACKDTLLIRRIRRKLINRSVCLNIPN